jgi:hypothetical protein
MKEYTANGIMYTWELAGSEGASFMLFPEESHAPEQIKAAKQWLRDNHDVVSLHIASEEDRDDLYKTEYFRDKRTRDLKWYEIEQDPKLIRRERKKGTAPAEFVERFVLPFVEQTKKKMFEQFGEKILTNLQSYDTIS